MPSFLRQGATTLAAAASLAVAGAAADTFQVTSGSGQRAFQLPAFGGAAGQSFTAMYSTITAFGFQFVGLNAGAANLPFTFDLYAGETLTGTSLLTRSFTLPTAINGRTPVWYDLDLGAVAAVVGQRYTAVLSTANTRNGVVLGPDINIFTGAELSGDAYAGGRALFAREVYPNCAPTGNCDLNFRVTGVGTGAPVPEPASWAMMVAGFAAAGVTMRRRRAGNVAPVVAH